MCFRCLFSLVVLLGVSPLRAGLSLPHVFGDHMVLQGDKPVRIWGWADAGESVQVSFRDRKATAKADEKGKWLATLEPMKASFEGAELRVTSK